MEEDNPTGVIDVVGEYACPIDPSEAAQCESCQ